MSAFAPKKERSKTMLKTILIDCGPEGITKEQKYELIDFFHGSYYDTPQEEWEFALEYMYVTSEIMSGRVPMELEYLVDYQKDLLYYHDYLVEFILKNGFIDNRKGDF